MSPSRDYYADLELPPTADIQEIKRQFRKLALRYHPDRNPGKEQEVNAKFQIIQCAHEVLGDPQQKARYDATLGRTSRYPASSGVKGNPWSGVSQQFPPPPRRNNGPRNPPPSGAQRWERFSGGVPPTAKQHASSEADARKNAAKAFEGMRKGQPQASGRTPQRASRPPPPPPPPPPRTETARQRAQASFGNRRSSHYAQSPVPGDVPQGTNQTSSSRPASQRSNHAAPKASGGRPPPMAMPDPLRQFRYPDQDGGIDSRQSTPYMTHGGEKTNPFDGVPAGYTEATTRMPSHDDQSSQPFAKGRERRSSSVPRPSASSGKGPNLGVPEDDRRPHTAHDPHNPSSFNFETGADDDSENDKHNANRPDGETQGPSMYETPQSHRPPSLPTSQRNTRHITPSRGPIRGCRVHDEACVYGSQNGVQESSAPSGDEAAPIRLLHFEKALHRILEQLITNSHMKEHHHNHSHPSRHDPTSHIQSADRLSFSFNLPVDDDSFTPASAATGRFDRTSVDNINTKFSEDGETSTWQFSAGQPDSDGAAETQPRPGSGPGSRPGRRSPPKRQTTQRSSRSNPDFQATRSEGSFNADGWSDKFGPQTFAPQPTPASSTSPTRSSRANSRKSKPTRPTAGSAAIVDESSDDDIYQWAGRRGQGVPTTTESPQAMDIDSPPLQPAEELSQTHDARNIPVEPSRPEWRPGNFEGLATNEKTEDPGSKLFNANAAGSEDSEEFRASFGDLKNVAPLSQEAEGLHSFSDLKDSLPFDSKAASALPVNLPKVPPLVFPSPPQAPKLPPTVAISGMMPNMPSWNKYLEDFKTYLEQWDELNAQVVDHFSTRKSHIARQRASKGYDFLGARGDSDVQDYYSWVQQDNFVRRKWLEACEEHEKQFRAYLAFREKMK